MFRTKSGNLRKRTSTTLAWMSLTLALLLPLAFINIRDSHDWGDDFAMYLLEAQNIAEGRAPGATGFMTNPYAEMGPPAYPVGFPLLLSPVVKTHGIDFQALNIFQSCLLICALFSGFLFLRRHFSTLSSLLMTLVIAYNPVLLNFKTEILSDIPFWILLNLTLCIVYYHRYSGVWMLLTGALLGFSLHLRSIGLALLLSFVIYRLVSDALNRDLLRYAKSYLLFILGFLTVWLGIRLAFPVDSTYSYLSGDLLATSANHLSYNLESLSNFFRSPALSDYYFITGICAWSFMTFLILGFVISIRNQGFTFALILSLVFFGAVIVYHLGDAGIRLILPLLFVFFYYFALGLKTTLLALQFNYKVPAYIGAALLLWSYILPLQKIVSESHKVLEGPCTNDSRQVFSYMQQRGIRDRNIGFDRPRALALFTGNNSVHLSDEHLGEELSRYHLDYVLVHALETSEAKKKFFAADTLRFKSLFSNATYQLFEVR